MTEREVPLKRKSESVSLMVDPVFMDAAPILKTAWTLYGAECVVTSGRDGRHSRQSAHDKGKALDLRSSNIFPPRLHDFAKRLSLALVINLGPYWYVVLEKDHIHIEYAGPGERPNIKGFIQGKHFYKEGG